MTPQLREYLKGFASTPGAVFDEEHRAELAAVMATTFSVPADLSLDLLSPREREALRYVAKGFTSKELGTLMKVSVFTANDYVKKLFEKLGVESRAEAAVLACKLGLA